MTVKRKTLFDHVNAIYTDQSVGYYDNLSVEDRKSFGIFMVNRFISMNMDFVEIVNEIQKHWGIVNERDVYLFYSQILPRGKQWNKYVKAKGGKEKKYDEWVLKLLAEYYSVSQTEATMYLETFMKTPEGKKALKEIFEAYGVEPRKIKKVVR